MGSSSKSVEPSGKTTKAKSRSSPTNVSQLESTVVPVVVPVDVDDIDARTRTSSGNSNSSKRHVKPDIDLINKMLPRELILRCFSYLDIVSLCRCAQVSKVKLNHPFIHWNPIFGRIRVSYQYPNLYPVYPSIFGYPPITIPYRLSRYTKNIGFRV